MSYAVAEHPAHDRLLSEESYAGGQAFQYVIEQIGEARTHYGIPITRQRGSVESRFQGLVQTWRADVAVTSSLTQMAMHPAYQQIIGMGREAIPLLLREIERKPDHWFWALKAITGVDPVDPGLKGRLDEMAKAWLRWGKEQGFRW